VDPSAPGGYGGIEAVVELLCEALVAQGHDVTLFAAPGSRSTAHVHALLEEPHPDTIGSALHESDHVACAWEQVDLEAAQHHPFNVWHDHSGFTALAMADRVAVPVVHTIHGPFDRHTSRFYQRHGRKATLVAISRSQAASAPGGVGISAVVPNPIAVDRWPLNTEKQDYVLWIGRMVPMKGAHRAIEAARLPGKNLVLAGPVQTGQEQPFRERIEPHIDGQRVRYVGDVAGAAKQQLYANAQALLMPVLWPEPFGMVMIEALATGTPVIAFPEGAAEIVIDGENGMLVSDEPQMARAIDQVGAMGATDPAPAARASPSATTSRSPRPATSGSTATRPVSSAHRRRSRPTSSRAAMSKLHSGARADDHRGSANANSPAGSSQRLGSTRGTPAGAARSQLR